MRHDVLTVAVLLASLVLTFSVACVEPIFYTPFDGDADAKVSAGNGKANITGAPKYENAKVGDGVVLSGRDFFAFETAKNVNAEVGTIMLWVKLSKDSSKLTTQEEFFSMYIDDNNRMRLHLDNTDLGIHWFYKIGGKSGIASKTNIGWKGGEWHRVIGTWQKGMPLILYLDNEKIVGAESMVLDPLPQLFYIGSYRGTGSFLQGTMDEFCIFDKYDITTEPAQSPVQFAGKLATYWGRVKEGH